MAFEFYFLSTLRDPNLAAGNSGIFVCVVQVSGRSTASYVLVIYQINGRLLLLLLRFGRVPPRCHPVICTSYAAAAYGELLLLRLCCSIRVFPSFSKCATDHDDGSSDVGGGGGVWIFSRVDNCSRWMTEWLLGSMDSRDDLRDPPWESKKWIRFGWHASFGQGNWRLRFLGQRPAVPLVIWCCLL